MSSIKKTARVFKVDARALISLGRESIKNHTTALIELVKNSYDADADNVEVEIACYPEAKRSFIRIADDGIGMESDDINRKWLRIGFSEKRSKKISAKGRRETGEKGIGRLSADRLGAVLELRSCTENSSPVGITVSWNDFDVDGADIGSVTVLELRDPVPQLAKRDDVDLPPSSGTEIIIRDLRQDWSAEDIEELELELATLIPPKVIENDFNLWLKSSVESEFELISSAVEASAELELQGKFDKNGRLVYQISGRPIKAGQNRKTIRSGTANWNQLVHPDNASNYSLGRVGVSLAFYLRSAAGLSGSLTLAKLREFLNDQAGVRIYRDGIRVKPYGDPLHPEGDWLGLSERKARNPAGAARSDFRISGNQLLGAIEIGRDTNPELSDSAAREGLIHGLAYSTLRAAVSGCIGLLERTYHEQFKEEKAERETKPSDLPAVVEDIGSELAGLTKTLSEVGKSSDGPGAARLRGSVQQLAQVSERFAQARKEIEELANQNTVYRGLATVGISTAVFGHETEGALAQAKLSASLANKLLSGSKPNIDLSKAELVKVEKAIAKVGVWGQFALSRVKRDKRRRTKIDLSQVVAGVVDEVFPLYATATIQLEQNIKSGIELRAFVMDVEALVLNLLTNAYHHASLTTKNRRVSVSLARLPGRGSASVKLTVSDSGPGIAKEHVAHIWTPLFSTKIDKKGRSVGTGLGLTIVKSIVADLGAEISAISKGPLGGASFEIVIPVNGQ